MTKQFGSLTVPIEIESRFDGERKEKILYYDCLTPDLSFINVKSQLCPHSPPVAKGTPLCFGPSFLDQMVLWFYVAAALINLMDNPCDHHF